MINAKSLSHPTTQARIYAAMRWAQYAANSTEYPPEPSAGRYNLWQYSDGSGECRIRNKKGGTFLIVQYKKGPQAFGFFTKDGKEITADVLTILRG